MTDRSQNLENLEFTYELENVKRPLKFFVFSDLHMNDNIKPQLLDDLLCAAKEQNPDYIFFLGDLIHTIQYLDNKKNYTGLLQFLEKMSNIAPTYIIIGNHDMRSYDPETDLAFMKYPEKFWKDVESKPNITVLHDTEINNDDFYLAGMEQGAKCYGIDREEGLNKYQRNILFAEKPKIMKEKLDTFLGHLQVPKDCAKPRILLLHSARFLGRRETSKWVKDFDVIMSGHLHNMGVPRKVFEKAMKAYGLSSKKGHFVCPPVTVFVTQKFQRHYKRFCSVVNIIPKT